MADAFGERNPILFGVPTRTMEQGVVTANVIPARKEFKQRATMAGTLGQGLVIPGAGSTNDPVFNIRPGDPLFARRSDLAMSGSKLPRVFTSLNGMRITNFRTSAEFDQELVYIGQSAEGYEFGSSAKDRLALTAKVSTTGTFVNNGTLPLFVGDLVAYKTPYWNMLPPIPDPTLGPERAAHIRSVNADWVSKVSGHHKTVRVVPHLTKVTGQSIVMKNEELFNKLLTSSELIGMRTDRDHGARLFPTMKVMDPEVASAAGRSHRRLDPDSLTACARYNDASISALHVIQVLIKNGFLQFRPDGANGISGIPGTEVTNFMQLAGIIGAYEAQSFKDWLGADPQLVQRKVAQQKGIIRQILYRIFHPYTSIPLKEQTMVRMTDWEDRQRMDGPRYERQFKNCMMKACKQGHTAMYCTALSDMKNVVGVVTKGGGVRQTVDIDARPCIPV